MTTPSEQVTVLQMELNGREVTVEVPVRRTLADALRDDLGLTGTHLGCEHGVCGACTVLLDGRSVRACTTLAVQAEGRAVTTVEGLSPDDGGLTPLQQELSERGGLQCGFCTPGFVVAATELLRDRPDADEAEVRSALSGNLCRCTGYEAIVDAVLAQRGRPLDAPEAGPFTRGAAAAADAAVPDAPAPSGRADAGDDEHGPTRRGRVLVAAAGAVAAILGGWLWWRARAADDPGS